MDCPCIIKVAAVSSENYITINTSSEAYHKDTIQIEDSNEQSLDILTEFAIRKGYSPYINKETNTWWEYDDVKHYYFDTGVLAGEAILKAIPIEDVRDAWQAIVGDEER